MDLVDSLIKEYGDIIQEASVITDRPPRIIPISPAIDVGLGGGISSGSLITLSGPPKLGKTLTALSIAGQAQKEEYQSYLCEEPRDVYYLNCEARLKTRDLKGIYNLRTDRQFYVIGSQPSEKKKKKQGKILTAEDFLSIAEKIIHEKPGSIVIVDSFSFLITGSELSSDMEDMSRAAGAKLLYKFFRRIAGVVPVNDIILIGILHLISNPSGRGKSTQESSGNAVKFMVDFKLEGQYCKLIKDSSEITTGLEVYWKVGCSAFGPPGTPIKSYITYNHGLDSEKEVVDLACDLGIIEKNGSWYVLAEDNKIQGIEKVADYLRGNPDVYNTVYDKIKQAFRI